MHAGMRGARWDAWCALECAVHAGLRGARWFAWCALECAVRTGLHGVDERARERPLTLALSQLWQQHEARGTGTVDKA